MKSPRNPQRARDGNWFMKKILARKNVTLAYKNIMLYLCKYILYMFSKITFLNYSLFWFCLPTYQDMGHTCCKKYNTKWGSLVSYMLSIHNISTSTLHTYGHSLHCSGFIIRKTSCHLFPFDSWALLLALFPDDPYLPIHIDFPWVIQLQIWLWWIWYYY